MRILITLLILAVSTICYADVYVLYDKNTKQVLSVSDKDDAVVTENMKLLKLHGKKKELDLQYDDRDYKVTNNRLIVNVAKQSADAEKAQKYTDKVSELKQIENRMMKDTCLKLESEGVVFKEIKCSDF